MKKYFLLLTFCLLLFSCDQKSKVEKAVEKIPVKLKVIRFEKAFFAFDSNLLKFIIPDIYENYELYNKKFLTSQNARILVKSILNKKILS